MQLTAKILLRKNYKSCVTDHTRITTDEKKNKKKSTEHCSLKDIKNNQN